MPKSVANAKHHTGSQTHFIQPRQLGTAPELENLYRDTDLGQKIGLLKP